MPNQGSKNPRVYSGSINRNCSKNIVARLLLAHTRGINLESAKEQPGNAQ
jgi:hypothetical protein